MRAIAERDDKSDSMRLKRRFTEKSLGVQADQAIEGNDKQPIGAGTDLAHDMRATQVCS